MIRQIIVLILLIISIQAEAQIVVAGYLFDTNTEESIIGAVVKQREYNTGTHSNNFGFFSLNVKQLPCQIIISYIGYKSDTMTISEAHHPLKIYLKPNSKNLKEVVVKQTKSLIQKAEMGTLEIPIDQIKQLPAIGGEVDVLKAFQLMPGIQGGSEGTSGLYIRGGTPDQNLILLDDVPMYYVNHIGGFVSVFDVNAINSIKLVKGGFPARYGGRLSSVVDIRMKNGNATKLKGEYGLGILTSKLFLEGPLGKRKKTKFMISGRRCNLDLATRLSTKMASGSEYSAGYTFYDLYGKIVHNINDRNNLSLTLYQGRDRIFINQNNKESLDKTTLYDYSGNIRWGNIVAAAKWGHQYNAKVYGNTTLSYTGFNYNNLIKYKQKEINSNNTLATAKQSFISGVQDFIIRHDMDINYSSAHSIKIGAHLTHHIFNPGISVSRNPYIDTSFGSLKVNAQEATIFIEDELRFSSKFNANIGLHFNSYFVQSSIFPSLQPRLSLNYTLHKNHAIKASYTFMQQNIHLLSNNGAGIPTDLWVPATSMIKPQYSNQYSLGYYFVPNHNVVEFSVEAYYKTLKNQIEFSEGASFFGGENNWEEKVQYDGIGRCYGVEFLIQKKEGRLSGWMSYTLSYNYRKFDSINEGIWYPYKYDRRHYFTTVANYKLRKNIILSADFLISTGHAITLPNGKYATFNTEFNTIVNSNSPVPVFNQQADNTYTYAGRNQSRMPANHRLDVAVRFIKEKYRGSREVVISVYNVYSRQNPYFVFFDYDKQKNIHLYQLSLFPIIPSISYVRNF